MGSSKHNRKKLGGTAIHRVISEMHSDPTGFTTMDLPGIFRCFLEEAVEEAESEAGELGVEINWNGDPKSAKAAITEEYGRLLLAYREDPRNQECDILLNEGRFEVLIGIPKKGRAFFEFFGTIDQVRRLPDGRIGLIDLKSGAEKPTKLSLMLSTELAIYYWAAAYGKFLDEAFANIHPDFVGIWHLRDYEAYKKNQYKQFIETGFKIKNELTGRMGKELQENPEYVTGYKEGERRGDNLIALEMGLPELMAITEDISSICKAIRFNMFPRRPADQQFCFAVCEYKELCVADLKMDTDQWEQTLDKQRTRFSGEKQDD
jgi:RecB family exonuclease